MSCVWNRWGNDFWKQDTTVLGKIPTESLVLINNLIPYRYSMAILYDFFYNSKKKIILYTPLNTSLCPFIFKTLQFVAYGRVTSSSYLCWLGFLPWSRLLFRPRSCVHMPVCHRELLSLSLQRQLLSWRGYLFSIIIKCSLCINLSYNF